MSLCGVLPISILAFQVFQGHSLFTTMQIATLVNVTIFQSSICLSAMYKTVRTSSTKFLCTPLLLAYSVLVKGKIHRKNYIHYLLTLMGLMDYTLWYFHYF